jgi:hypothetical protein
MVGTVPLTGSEPPAAVQADVRRSGCGRALATFLQTSIRHHFFDCSSTRPGSPMSAEAGFTHWRLAEQTPFNLILEARA